MRKRKKGCGCGCSFFFIIIIISLLIGAFFYFTTRVDLNKIREIEQMPNYISVVNMPEYTKQAFIAVEDKRFLNHNGIDAKGTTRAIFVSLKNFEISQGGSTITQQLVKNVYFSNEQSLTRKVKEMIVAKRVENHYTKDEILSAYLSTIYFGNNIYNIESAAHTYFGTTTNVNNAYYPPISVLQSAILASTINAPSMYHPEQFNSDIALQKRTRDTLKKMVDQNYITKTTYEQVVIGIPE